MPSRTGDDAAARAPAAAAVAWLAGVSAVGSAVMALAHTGAQIPLISSLGPSVGDAVPQAAFAFSGATALFGAIVFGVVTRRGWVWALALAVNALTLLAAARPLRGAVSVVAIAITAIAILILVSPRGRAALRPPARR